MKHLEFLHKENEFREGETSGLGCSNTRHKAWIDHIEIEGNIDGLVPEALDHCAQRTCLKGDNGFHLSG
jgi:hypothetical protein